MSLLRVPQSVQVTLSHVFYVDEVATAPTGTLTATVKRLDGTQIAGSPFTYTVAGTTCSFALPAQPNLDALTVDWVGTVAGAAITARDIVEIVGGFYFGLAEAREELGLSPSVYPAAKLAAKRIAVEVECEDIRRQAQVPRFTRRVLNGSGTCELLVPDMELRVVRSASVAPRAGGTFTPLTAGQLAAVAAEPSGILIRDDGASWPLGHRNVIVEYEYGLDMPSPVIKDAAIVRLRSMLSKTKSNVPDRALSFSVAEGGTYRIATPGPRSTGDPDVDAAYLRNANMQAGFA